MEKMAYAQINDLIGKGYTSLDDFDSKVVCDCWLAAWNAVLKLRPALLKGRVFVVFDIIHVFFHHVRPIRI